MTQIQRIKRRITMEFFERYKIWVQNNKLGVHYIEDSEVMKGKMLTPRANNKHSECSFSSLGTSEDAFFEIDEELLISSEKSRNDQNLKRDNAPQIMPELFVGGLDPEKSVSSATTQEFKNDNNLSITVNKMDEYVRTNSAGISLSKRNHDQLMNTSYKLGKQNTLEFQSDEKKISSQENLHEINNPQLNKYTDKRKLFIINSRNDRGKQFRKVISKPKLKRKKKSILKIVKERDAQYNSVVLDCVINDQRLRLEELLFKKTVNLEHLDEFGNTALNIAAQNGMVEIIKILIKAGANLNSKNFFGNTPLHYAISYNFKEATDILCKSGANQLIKNKEGKSPWDII